MLSVWLPFRIVHALYPFRIKHAQQNRAFSTQFITLLGKVVTEHRGVRHRKPRAYLYSERCILKANQSTKKQENWIRNKEKWTELLFTIAPPLW